MASSALALLLPRGVPALRAASASLPRRCALGILAAVEPLSPPAAASAGEGAPASSSGGPKATHPLKALHGTPWNLHPDYRRWKDAEEEILRDIEPIRMLTKHILHSDRLAYTFFVREIYHMKIEQLQSQGMFQLPIINVYSFCYQHYSEQGYQHKQFDVDRHPQFKHSRCLFVV
ncbi:uncharacterized protein LOC121975867 isoform X2 [Zingiber officinale]|uniref:uncharacterized protein LOC121975867 isoform X2 n=1 Tax=Zingiber officinale TaxID=94328 RepID=UPI001C4D6635|nr:uncharacterized protein LOC121975867 isoform X2 [Zingiber officinale]